MGKLFFIKVLFRLILLKILVRNEKYRAKEKKNLTNGSRVII